MLSCNTSPHKWPLRTKPHSFSFHCLWSKGTLLVWFSAAIFVGRSIVWRDKELAMKPDKSQINHTEENKQLPCLKNKTQQIKTHRACSCCSFDLALPFRSSPTNFCSDDTPQRGSSSDTLAGLSFFKASGSLRSNSRLPSGCWCDWRNSLTALFSSRMSCSWRLWRSTAILSFLVKSAAV